MRHGASIEHSQLRTDRPHPGPHHPGGRRPPRRGVDDQHPAGQPPHRGLQPGRPVLRADVVEPAGPDRRDDGPRGDQGARRHPDRRSGDPLLPGQLLGDVRQGDGGPAEGVHAVLSPEPLRGRQGLRALDHRQLPRELRPACLLGHLVQPRVAPARSRVRHPQGHPWRGPDQGGHRREVGAGQSRCPARLGLRRRLRAGHVADAPTGPARRLRGGHRRDPLGQGAGGAVLRRRRARLGTARLHRRAVPAPGRGRSAGGGADQGGADPRLAP